MAEAGAGGMAAAVGGVPAAGVAGGTGEASERFDVRTLPPVVVISGHYGVGKTNLALNLALDARAAGREVALADLDVVNPYFRSSDYGGLLADAGVELIAPAFAGTTLDSPGITGKVLTAVERAREGVAEPAGEAVQASTGGAEPGALASGPAPAAASPRLLIIDAGGDDVGATVLGRFAGAIAAGPYAMLQVVNRSRNLTHTPAEALSVLREVERASKLAVTAIANNTHLADQTTPEVLAAGFSFAREVAEQAGVPLAFTTVDASCNSRAQSLGVVYPVRILVRKPWE